MFGAKCSQFLFNACIDFHLLQSGTSIARKIKENIDIDNLQITSSDESELINLYIDSKSLMGSAGFELLVWITNSTKLQKKLAEKGKKRLKNEITILDLLWNIKGDTLSFPTKNKDQNANTMGKVLSNLDSVYDPLGIISPPVVVIAKIFMQDLWKQKLHWTIYCVLI